MGLNQKLKIVSEACQGLEYKKFLRSPEDYLGQIVLMRGEMVGTGGTPAETLFKYVFVSSKPEQKSFHLLGLTPQSSVHKLRADDFLLIGAVTPGVPSMTGWGTKAGIDIYMICGILSDPPSKRAEVRCASGK